MNETPDAVPDLQAASESSPTQLRRASSLGAVVRRNRVVRTARQEAEQGGGAARSDDRGGDPVVQPRTVVVIDDELDQVDLTVLLLQASGHHAIGSTDGSEAVALVAGEGGEVVVLDFMLAGMTGGDVCSALRAEPATSQVRIVLLSATSEPDVRRTCTQYDTYLSKPTSRKALFKAIERP